MLLTVLTVKESGKKPYLNDANAPKPVLPVSGQERKENWSLTYPSASRRAGLCPRLGFLWLKENIKRFSDLEIIIIGSAVAE